LRAALKVNQNELWQFLPAQAREPGREYVCLCQQWACLSEHMATWLLMLH